MGRHGGRVDGICSGDRMRRVNTDHGRLVARAKAALEFAAAILLAIFLVLVSSIVTVESEDLEPPTLTSTILVAILGLGDK